MGNPDWLGEALKRDPHLGRYLRVREERREEAVADLLQRLQVEGEGEILWEDFKVAVGAVQSQWGGGEGEALPWPGELAPAEAPVEEEIEGGWERDCEERDGGR